MCAWAWGDSFDCYAAPADAVNGYWDSSTNTSVIIGAGRFAGSQSFRWQGTGNSTMIKTSGVNDAVHHIAVAFLQSATITGSTLGTYVQLLDGATAQCSIVFRSDGAILLTSGGPAGTVLDTYTGAFPVINTWYAFEFEVIISNTVGRFRVRKNGNPADDYDSTAIRDTQNSANAYANKIQIAQQAAVNLQALDDLFWRSDASAVAWMGDIRCYTRMPASDASVQFARTSTGVLTQTATGTFNGSQNMISIANYTAFTAGYSGVVNGVSVSVATVGNAVNMKCAIFADDGTGRPGALLASATAPVTPVVVGSHAFTFTGVTVVKGTQYWVGASCDGTTTSAFSSTNSNAANGAVSNTAYAVFPQTNPVTTMPAFAGQKSWTYTATPANWQAVSEAQQDAATSYVYDSTPGDADFYGIGAIASTPVSTIAVTTRALMQKSDAGSRTAAVQLKSGGTTVASPTMTLSSSGWLWAWRTDTVDPNTSVAWTAAGVNNAQVGPRTVT